MNRIVVLYTGKKPTYPETPRVEWVYQNCERFQDLYRLRGVFFQGIIIRDRGVSHECIKYAESRVRFPKEDKECR